MITLREIAITNFKSLREVSLTLPREGAILVSGQNEAGKSTLFEAVYFGLYGSLLNTADNSGSLIDGIAYGSETATVRVVVDAGGTVLDISRTLRRGKTQQARLRVQVPGRAVEEVAGIREIARRIPAEMGGLDGEALLNSCFVEQKKLSKLEDLGGKDREASMLRLLNLERMGQLDELYKVRLADRDRLDQTQGRAAVARLRRQLTNLDMALRELGLQTEAALYRGELVQADEAAAAAVAAVREEEGLQGEATIVAEDLATVGRVRAALQVANSVQGTAHRAAAAVTQATDCSAELAALERRALQELPQLEGLIAELEEVSANVAIIDAQLEEAQQAQHSAERSRASLQQAESLNSAAASARQAAEQAAEECSQLDRDLAARQHTATEMLPVLQERVRCLDTLVAEDMALQQLHAQLPGLEAKHGNAETSVAEVASVRVMVAATAEAARRAAADRDASGDGGARSRLFVELLHERNALQEWLRSSEMEAASTTAGADLLAAEAAHDAAQREEIASRARVARVGQQATLFGGGIVVDLVIAALGGLMHLTVLLMVGVVLLLGLGAAEIAALTWRRSVGAVAAKAAEQLSDTTERVRTLQARREALAQVAAGDDRRAGAAARLRSLGRAEPGGASEAEARLSAIAAEGTAGLDIESLTIRAEGEAAAIAGAREAADRAAAEAYAASERLAVLEAEGREEAANHAAESLEEHRQRIRLAARTLNQGMQTLGLAPGTALGQELGASRAECARQEVFTTGLNAVKVDLLAARQRAEAYGATAQRARDALAAIDVAAVEQALRDAEQCTHLLAAERMRRLEALAPQLARCVVGANRLEVERLRAQASEQLRQLRAALDGRAALAAERDLLLERAKQARVEGEAALETVRAAIEAADLTLPAVLDDRSVAQLCAGLEGHIASLNEVGLGERRQRVLAAIEQVRSIAHEQQQLSQSLRESAAARRQQVLEGGGSEHGALLLAMTRSAEDVRDEAAGVERTRDVVLDREVQAAAKWQLTGVPLDLDVCTEEAETLGRQLQVREKACLLLRLARTRMVQRVLPNTERNMCMLLPLLTEDRYHDAQITDDYQIRVWDAGAHEYKSKAIFSGGTRDQFSLALRLAFALAALPQELGTTPGFIFLDEVMGAADDRRALAIQDLLTRGPIASNFAQILVVSHGKDIDTSLFPYRITLSEGRVVESNLPGTKNELVPPTKRRTSEAVPALAAS